MTAAFPVQRVAAGPSLNVAGRRRPVDRIDSHDQSDLLVDHDNCRLDGQSLVNVDHWRTALCANRLSDIDGAFALAWRRADGSVLLARDAIGERTLFYYQTANELPFASTIRSLLQSDCVSRRLNLAALGTYLSYAYLPGRETLIAGLYEVLPGEVVEFRNGQLTRQPFWSLPTGELTGQSESELRLELRRRLEHAVSVRLPSNEIVGATLSGGIDSSLVVALAARLHDRLLKTYSISFGDEYANELPYSSMVAEHCRTDHRILELSPLAIVRHLDDTITQLNDPIGDPLTVPNALVFREAAHEVGVVLNGEGGDPCFGGPKNLPMLLSELYDSGPGARERSYLRAHLKCYDDLDTMVTPQVREALRTEPLEDRVAPWLRDTRWPHFVSRLQAINVAFKGGHHILPKVDALGAVAGVLPRSPLFDRSIVELSFAIPPRWKLNGSVEKYLLKESVRDLLPSIIVDRPKSGMMVPVEAWFQGPLLDEARQRLLDGLSTWDIVERNYLERLLAGKLGGLRPRRGAKIWLLVTLEAWLRCVLRS